MPSKFASADRDRPTLPSIHTLNLLSVGRHNLNYDNERYAPMSTPRSKYHHDRQASTSSSRTSASRTSSPSPHDAHSRSPTTPNITSSSPVTKFRLVPCPIENADAILFVPPSSTSQVSNYAPRSGKGRGILMLGQDLHQFRSERRPLAKGARIHPYRVVLPDNSSRSRRSSIISVTSFSPNV